MGRSCICAIADENELATDEEAGAERDDDSEEEIDTPSSRASPFSKRVIVSFVLKSNAIGSHFCTSTGADSDTTRYNICTDGCSLLFVNTGRIKRDDTTRMDNVPWKRIAAYW